MVTLVWGSPHCAVSTWMMDTRRPSLKRRKLLAMMRITAAATVWSSRALERAALGQVSFLVSGRRSRWVHMKGGDRAWRAKAGTWYVLATVRHSRSGTRCHARYQVDGHSNLCSRRVWKACFRDSGRWNHKSKVTVSWGEVGWQWWNNHVVGQVITWISLRSSCPGDREESW